MADDTIIERVAAALARALEQQEPDDGGSYYLDAQDIRAAEIDGTFDLIEVARAVLVELRKPTVEMLEEGRRDDLPATADAVWNRMVSAAIGEQVR